MDLTSLLGTQFFSFFIVFVRVGVILMFMPGIGEVYVPPRLRLSFALIVSFIIAPLSMVQTIPVPNHLGNFFLLILKEIIIGGFLGSLSRLALYSLETAGAIIAGQISLSNVYVMNPTLGQQGSLPGVFMMMLGGLLIFSMNIHHILLQGVVESYTVFPITHDLPYEEISGVVVRLVAQSFSLAVKIAAPFLVTSMVMFIMLGILNRLMPHLQVFFISQPLQIAFGLVVFVIMLDPAFQVFIVFLESSFINFPLSSP